MGVGLAVGIESHDSGTHGQWIELCAIVALLAFWILGEPTALQPAHSEPPTHGTPMSELSSLLGGSPNSFQVGRVFSYLIWKVLWSLIGKDWKSIVLADKELLFDNSDVF